MAPNKSGCGTSTARRCGLPHRQKEITMADSQQIAANLAIDNHSATCAFCNEPETANELGCPEKGRLYAALFAVYLAEKADNNAHQQSQHRCACRSRRLPIPQTTRRKL